MRDALSTIHTRDPDEWAAGWGRVADRYMADAASNPARADADRLRAWRLYYFAQWPVPSSPGKQAGYAKALDAYAQHAAALDPKIETVHIPFEGREIVGYLRLPKGVTGPAPLILAISGLDSRKETVAETYNAILPEGVGYFAVDSPGTGQAPIKVSPTADRMFSAVLDYLQTRAEIDHSRIIAHGVSFGGYWATKLALTEHGRLLGVVAQSPPVDGALQASFLRTNLLGKPRISVRRGPCLSQRGRGWRHDRQTGRGVPQALAGGARADRQADRADAGSWEGRRIRRCRSATSIFCCTPVTCRRTPGSIPKAAILAVNRGAGPTR